MRGKKLNGDQKLMIATGTLFTVLAITTTAFNSCKPKPEKIQQVPVPAVSSKNGVAEVYKFVQDYVSKRSSHIKGNLTSNKEGKISVIVRVKISEDGSVTLNESHINCYGKHCLHSRQNGFDDLATELAKLNVGPQKKSQDIAIPVYIE